MKPMNLYSEVQLDHVWHGPLKNMPMLNVAYYATFPLRIGEIPAVNLIG
jgi:hypothetical protein